jgi:hypothetical protein
MTRLMYGRITHAARRSSARRLVRAAAASGTVCRGWCAAAPRLGVRRLAAAFVPAYGRVPNGLDESSVPSTPGIRTLPACRTKSGGKPPHSKARFARNDALSRRRAEKQAIARFPRRLLVSVRELRSRCEHWRPVCLGREQLEYRSHGHGRACANSWFS